MAAEVAAWNREAVAAGRKDSRGRSWSIRNSSGVDVVRHSRERQAARKRSPDQLRGQIISSRVSGARVARSDGGGVYDKASMQIVNGMQVYTDVTASRIPPRFWSKCSSYRAGTGASGGAVEGLADDRFRRLNKSLSVERTRVDSLFKTLR